MKIFDKVTVPDDKRVFFVGDIHGAFDLYLKGCKDLGITDEDVVVSLGDLIDRGPKNFECVVEFTRKENRYAIQGNHEDLMIKGMLNDSHQHFDCWFLNGGNVTWEEVGGEQGSMALAEMVKDLPVILEVEHQGKRFGCVHGGIPYAEKLGPWDNLVDYTIKNPSFCDKLVWDRSVIDLIQTQLKSFKFSGVPGVKGVDYVLHGHTPVKNPLVQENRVYMDTGGFFNNRLTFAYYEKDKLNFYTTGDYDEL